MVHGEDETSTLCPLLFALSGGGTMFFTADPKDILEGKVTDVYFERALKILRAKNVNPMVKAEFAGA